MVALSLSRIWRRRRLRPPLLVLKADLVCLCRLQPFGLEGDYEVVGIKIRMMVVLARNHFATIGDKSESCCNTS